MSRLRLILLLLAPGLLLAQTDAALWRYVHPNAKSVIGLDWKRVRQSHFGTLLREKFVDGNPVAAAIPGIEFLDDIDRVIISSAGRANPDDPGEPPVLIAVRGRFDLARVRAVLARNRVRPQMFNSVPVYRPQGKRDKDLAVVLLDAQTILIGDAHSVFYTLEQSAFSPPQPETSTVVARAAQLDAAYEFWAVMSAPGALASDRLMDMFTGGAMNLDARSVEFGMSFRNGLAADITTAFEDEAAAKRMAGDLSKMLKLALKDKMGEPVVQDLEKHLKIVAEGPNTKITLRMTPQDVEKNAKIFSASRKSPAVAVTPVATPSAPPPAAPPPAPERKVIRIEGLDGGPKEIPYKQNQ